MLPSTLIWKSSLTRPGAANDNLKDSSFSVIFTAGMVNNLPQMLPVNLSFQGLKKSSNKSGNISFTLDNAFVDITPPLFDLMSIAGVHATCYDCGIGIKFYVLKVTFRIGSKQ
jgi:hypothetical protein